jgi:hypothetical protein
MLETESHILEGTSLPRKIVKHNLVQVYCCVSVMVVGAVAILSWNGMKTCSHDRTERFWL